MRALQLGLMVALALQGGALAAAASPMDWLIGRWVADGGGAEQGTGTFSFLPDAGHTVIVRRNLADYPAQNGKPASHHSDLMVIYRDDRGPRADYWDSEGHTIHYAVSLDGPSGEVVFLSDPGAGPRYRLTYRQKGSGLEGQFEIAPPNAPDQFKSYLTWRAKRRR